MIRSKLTTVGSTAII